MAKDKRRKPSIAELHKLAAGAMKKATTLAERDASSVVVTNEVGLGIVPMHELARRYRDTLGRVNAAFVSEAQHAYLVVAGRALSLEGVMPT